MHERQLRAHYLPSQVSEEQLVGTAAVVIDLLRASSTICQALAAGAREVVPFLEVEEAIAACAGEDRREIRLGGERSGGRIDGFDLGNSPAEYTADVVRGRRLFITTTNGTRALFHARLARRIVVGSLLNVSAVVASLKDEPRVELLCAGTDGEESGEDILAAGAMVHQLCRLPSADWHLSDAAAMAGDGWSLILAKAKLSGRTVNEELAIKLRDTPGGRNLLGIGLDQDLVDCAQVDRLNVVPELDVPAWRIRLA